MGGRTSERQVERTIRARAAEVIDKQREKMRRNLGTAIDGRDPEGVHDMRVASRRLRAALGLFAPWLGKKQVQQAGRSLRRLTRALGTVRELDVLRIRLDELASRASPERKLAIETIDSRIARGRVRARARMIKAFGSIDLDQLDARLRDLAGAPPAWALEGSEASGLDAGIPWNNPSGHTTPDEPIETLIAQLAPEVAETARVIVETQVPGEHGSREASDVLHDIRIRAKKLRYQLEIIAPHRGAEAAHLVETLKGLQDHLGDFHDDAVLDELLAENITRQAARARPLLVAELRRLRTARRAQLRRDERACRGSLENLRMGGFARAVSEVVTTVPEPAQEVPVTEPADTTVESTTSIETTDVPATQPGSIEATEPTAPATRTAGAGYAGEPIRKTPPEASRADGAPRATAQAAAAAGLPGGAALSRKP